MRKHLFVCLTLSLGLSLGFSLSVSLPAHADLDQASQKILIEKLDQIYLSLADNDPSKVPVTLRLADLYAERARQNSAGQDVGGADPQMDRTKALRLYNEVIKRAGETAKPKIMIQVGHLYEMNGREDLALKFYDQVLKTEKDPSVRAEADLSTGEIFFKRHDYLNAVRRFEEVLKYPEASSRGLAAYRKAWSHFHMGKVSEAEAELKAILRDPKLLTRNGTQTGQIDPQFKEEVSLDLATFMAKDKITKEGIETLFKLSPDSTRISNVQSLAFEAERGGKREEALLAWTFISGYLKQPQDRVAAQLSMAQLQLDRQDKASALSNYEKAISVWRELGFKDTTQDQELRRRARNFVVSWNQSEKKAPSVELYSAYDLYLSMFPNDIDAHLFAAEIAKQLKNYKAAWSQYTQARNLLTKDTAKQETVLLSLLELGESSKDPALMDQAYETYIQYSEKKTKLTEVRYQKAHAAYERGDYPAATEQLRAIALGKDGSLQLRKQAADLSLDALVLMKDEPRLLVWARDFEKAFPQSKADYANVVQKAVLTKSANLAERDPAAALVSLNEFDPAMAGSNDKVKYYKDKLILSEKLNHVSEAAAAADALLSLPQTSQEDRQFAWSRKAYLAELRLDFSTAFAATEKIQKGLQPDEKNFKLAVFAELSGRPSSPFYSAYLTQTKDEERKRLVAAELVRKSKTPEQELEKVKGVLRSSPELYAELIAETYAKTGHERLLKMATEDAKLKTTDAGRLMDRVVFLRSFAKLLKPLVADKLDTQSPAKLARSIKRRAALLDKVETAAKHSIQSGDWTSQLVSIDAVAKESERFYQDLMSAPSPQGLSPEEEQQYLNLLSAQASPFQTKAAEAKTKVSQFWQADWLKPLLASWERVNLRKVIQTEVDALKAIAPEDQIAKFDAFKDEIPTLANQPTTKELQSARQRVYANPLDATAIEDLLNLERQSKNTAMSEYLATRLIKLKTNKGTL